MTIALPTPAADPRPPAPLLHRAFDFEAREEAYRVERIAGRVPGYLRGSYYLNGPGILRRGGRAYRHWLDGDGLVRRLRFTGDGVEFDQRFVRSDKLRAEEAAGRFLYRAFGTRFADDRLERGIGLASPVNVSVYPFAGRLLAFGEQGLPWELDRESLETLGEHRFGGRLHPVSPFSAHPAFDAERGEMFNFGVSFSARRPALQLYRFDAAGGLLFRRRLRLERPVSIHDFGLSSGHVVFYLSPYVLEMEKLLAEGATALEALSWRPRHGSELLVAERAGGEPVARVPVGRGYCLHLIDAFESDGVLAVDVIELDRPVYDQYRLPDLFPDARGAQPVRYLVDLRRGRVVGTAALGYRRMCDFPAIDPRRAGTDYGDFWMLGISASERPGCKGFDELVHADWESGRLSTWRAPEDAYLGGEPVFLPDPGSDRDGSVICQLFDAARRESSFLLFDAFEIEAGPVAQLPLRAPTHLGFHAAWSPE